MIAERFTLDTNILIYAFDTNEPKRKKIAMKLIEKAIQLDCLLTLQSLSEFYYATTRKKYLPQKEALNQIEDWQTLFPIAIAKPGTLLRAISTSAKHKLSFWDAMLASTALDAGVDILLSEDFNHTQMIGNMKIINPFIDKDFQSHFF